MLKACWDCMAGDQQGRNDDPYRVHLNGTNGTQGSPWQSISNGNMFPLPKLKVRDQITIAGQMTQNRRLNLTLATNNGPVCQINVANRINDSDREDYIRMTSQGNVIYNNRASEIYNEDGAEFVFRFEVNRNGGLDVFTSSDADSNETPLESVAMDIDNLQMISVDGQVFKLTFEFYQNGNY